MLFGKGEKHTNEVKNAMRERERDEVCFAGYWCYQV